MILAGNSCRSCAKVKLDFRFQCKQCKHSFAASLDVTIFVIALVNIERNGRNTRCRRNTTAEKRGL